MEKLFDTIIGEQLSSVEFVQDYVQLRFDGNTSTYYSWPEVRVGTTTFRFGDMQYRNALCALIGQIVKAVSIAENLRFDIIFSNERSVCLSLKRDESTSSLPEFVYFTDVNGGWLVLD